MPFTKPEIPENLVLRRFKGRERDGQTPLDFEIRLVGKKHIEQFLEEFLQIFLTHEPTCKLFGLASDPASVHTIRSNWIEDIANGFPLGCFVNHQDRTELIGYAICEVKSIDDDDDDVDFDKIKGESWKKMLSVLLRLQQSVNVFHHYDVSEYITINVVAVQPEYYGNGIGVEMFRAVEILGKHLGLKATATLCTAIASQKCAAKLKKYEVLSEMTYNKMAEFRNIDFSQCDTKVGKVVGCYFG